MQGIALGAQAGLSLVETPEASVSGHGSREMTNSLSFGVFYDFRNPLQFRQNWTERYRQLLEQIDWVDGSSSFESVSVSEHHFVDDGYTPSVLALAAVMAARTSRVGIATNILQLPLHHPLRVAEDALTVDVLSGGRFRLGVANGYREQEFAGFGTTPRHRKARMEEALTILRGAFSNEPFSFDGNHWSFPELTVSPPPTDGGPEIWMGGTAPAALDRAARLGDGFFASTNEEVVGYLEACERNGVPPDRRRTCRTAWAMVDEDPERALSELGEHMLYQVNQYIDYGFLKMPPFDDPHVLVEMGFYTFVDAAGAIDFFREAADAGVQEIHLFGVLPGEAIESGTRRLQYVADKVIPTFSGS
jgi:alkanesulfonate monooxygenase SsuD/methylene tetrahydromethanopterin reductase-like flavin-dependent oxidoreductase (luciferase family)